MADDQIKDGERIRDPVHNLIKFSLLDKTEETLWSLVQSAPVQRLRRIKQLGFSDFVYPGASHSRFSHSLGAMQMARRMFDALYRNQKVSDNTAELKRSRTATLCAALLHDVGHGPFSHVFENLASNLDVKFHHVNFTLKIIRSDEILQCLRIYEGTDDLANTVASFFEEGSQPSIYSNIISSQIDADRLDFIVRDKYHTGIKFGEVDIDWLFDSLLVEELPSYPDFEVPVPTFVFSAKGLSVTEEYLLTYAHMYSSVYFHKTTRGVEVLVREALYKFLSNKDFRKALKSHPVVQFFDNDGDVDLKAYLELDDSTMLSLLREISHGDFDDASLLATRFFSRDLLKCFEPPRHPREAPPNKKIGDFVRALKDRKIEYFKDLTPSKGFKQFQINDPEFFQNIMVINRADGHAHPIGELSNMVRDFSTHPAVRFYFFNDAERSDAIRIWKSL